MAIIDPNGLFHGDRLTACSDMARLYWPYFVAASNNYGRLEINVPRIIKLAFGTFKQAPSVEQVAGYLREYRDNHLLFVYVADGTAWGQWDIPPQFLKRHKTADDRRSPAPPEDMLHSWKLEYERHKAEHLGALGDLLHNAPTYARTCEVTRECTEQVRGVGVGVGVGEGVGGGDGAQRPAPFNSVECARIYCDQHSLSGRSKLDTVAQVIDQICTKYGKAPEDALNWLSEQTEARDQKKPLHFWLSDGGWDVKPKKQSIAANPAVLTRQALGVDA